MVRATTMLTLAALAAPAPTIAQDWSSHGALKVSANGHYLAHADGTAFLWIGDTAWGMMQQLTRQQVDEYLDNRKKLGFTVIQSVAHWYPHGGGMKSGPTNAPNAYGFRPFVGEEDAPDTSRPLVVPGGSPEAPNDYWDNVDYVVQAIQRRGMYLALLPNWGRAYITSTFGGTRQQYDVAKARSFGQFLGERYAKVPNIIWVMGGDTKAQLNGFDKNQIRIDFDARPIFRAMAEGVAQGVTGRKAAWNVPSPVWDQVLMTYHPDGDPLDNSSKWFHGDAWLDANGVEVWQEVDQVYPVMLGDYQLTAPVKPSLFLEGSYEFGSYRRECGWVTPVKVRRQAYQTFFAGGAGHTYGAGPIWSMRGSGGDYNCGYTWQAALGFPAAVQVASIAGPFLKANAWWRWIPNGRVVDGVGEGAGRRSGVVDEAGQRALVYFATAGEARVRNVLKSTATASWFDPRDGHVEKAGSFSPGEMRDMTPPDRWEDAILVLEAR